MPMESADFEEVLQEALTERDMQLQEKELPEINIGEALPVKDGLDFLWNMWISACQKWSGRLKTASLVTKPTA